MAEDLAIDVGLEHGQLDYQEFVNDVINILKYGCDRIDEKTKDILDKCEISDLDIAKEVIDACRVQDSSKWWQKYDSRFSTPNRRTPSSPPQIRRKRVSRKQRRQDAPRRVQSRPARIHPRPMSRKREGQQRRPMSPMSPKQRRPMSPLFRRPVSRKREGQQRRPMSPMSPKQRRPMSPLFRRVHPRPISAERDRRNECAKRSTRPMSPLFSQQRYERSRSPNYERRRNTNDDYRYQKDPNSDVPSWPESSNPRKRRRR